MSDNAVARPFPCPSTHHPNASAPPDASIPSDSPTHPNTSSPLYVELHCHSAYSWLDGASLPEELAARAEALGYHALALTDHNGLYGSMEFAHQAKNRGLQPVTGAEVTLEDDCHLTLLVESPAGYANLCRLLSLAHQENERLHPRLSRQALADHAAGLIALSGCRCSDVGQAIDRGDTRAAEIAARQYRDWFGPENFFLELQQNLVKGDTARVVGLVEMARRLDMPVVATSNVHYHRSDRHRLQDTLVAVDHCTTLDNAHRVRRANGEFYLRSPQEMAALFNGLPEAITNTLQIAGRCQGFDITCDLGYGFPDFQGETGEDADAALARICRETLIARYRREPETIRMQARRRLEIELGLVQHHRLAGFFLVYRDLLEMGREVAARVRLGARGRFDLPPGRGRGSSVSSIICYLIGLSPVDPIRARLSLGRFLNKELASVPDIDLDFPRDIREELIKEVHRRYGREHVAMVAAYPTYRLRSAVRDIGKALGLPAVAVDRLARLSEGGRAGTVEEELRRIPGFERALDAAPWRRMVDLARELQGFPRHLSQHPGGMIISSRPLVELVPVEHSAMEGRRVCQWDKDSCDLARFIKIDFLALGMLSAVEETLNLIESNNKPPVDLSRIDFEDAVVYNRICAGDTVGVFQIESRAQIQMLPRTQPRNIEDLAVEVAIVRPGPISGGSVNSYVRKRQNLLKNPHLPVYFDHPLLIPVLGDTLGELLYQDQVLGVCQALAGFTVGRAEALRRAMSRRRSRAAMEEFRQEFLEGARKRGVHPRTSSRVFDRVLGFSQYGFPKAHAAAFAILAYQSTWLCHYYPVEFFAALLNNQPMGFYPRDVLLKEAQRHGVRFARPSINRSAVLCTVSSDTVRLGLHFIHGIGSKTAGAIAADREQHGPFLSLPDLVRRVALPYKEIENLVEAGALDEFGIERRMLLWELGLFARAQGWMEPHKAGTGSRASRRQPTLALPVPAATDFSPAVRLPSMNPWEKILTDYKLMDLSPDGHPMALLRPVLPKGTASAAQLQQIPDDMFVHTAGLVVTRQRPHTAKGFLFLLVEDETGLLNVVIHPRLYEQRRAPLRGEPLLWIKGKIQRRDGVLNIIGVDVGSIFEILHEPGQNSPAALFLRDLRRATPKAHQWR